MLGKEVALLIVVLLHIGKVNDRADSITTVLNAKRWGAPDSQAEANRQDLVLLTISSSVTPEVGTNFDFDFAFDFDFDFAFDFDFDFDSYCCCC
jgi:hypothetical protein